ncbi:hypothetical protein D9M68_873030 [compost metagenome]
MLRLINHVIQVYKTLMINKLTNQLMKAMRIANQSQPLPDTMDRNASLGQPRVITGLHVQRKIDNMAQCVRHSVHTLHTGNYICDCLHPNFLKAGFLFFICTKQCHGN